MLKSAKLLISLVAAGSAAMAQQAISVQSGLIHHVEGQVEHKGAPVKMDVGKFPMVNQGETLTSRSGRAEVLLTPGVFLRLGADSSLRMLSTALSDTRVEIVSGAALVEVVEIGKFNKVTLRIGESETSLQRFGLYLFDAGARRIRVFEGKATVAMAGESVNLSRGRQALLGATLTSAKFNIKEREIDALYAWSLRRGDLMAQANVSAATALRSNGYRMNSSMWAFYPGMGLMTFLPYSGYCRSAFGYGYYSPSTVWQYYAPREQPSYGGGGYDPGSRPGWSGMGGGASSGGYSGGSGSVSAASVDSGRAAAPAAAPAVEAPSGGRGR